MTLDDLKLLSFRQLWEYATADDLFGRWDMQDHHNLFSSNPDARVAHVSMMDTVWAQGFRLYLDLVNAQTYCLVMSSDDDRIKITDVYADQLLGNFGRLSVLLRGEFIIRADMARLSIKVRNVPRESVTPQLLIFLASQCLIHEKFWLLNGIDPIVPIKEFTPQVPG